MASNASEGSETHDSEEGHTSLTPRRTRSHVWEHFEKDLVNVDGELKAICKYCKLKLVTKSGTSSLRGHVANACPAIDSAIRKRFQASMSKEPVDTYFEEPLEPDPNNENFDILGWWKSRSDKFPVLSTMVRDFIAIPLSTVSSESAFSLGGRLLGERRSSLAPKMLEALVCGKDWLFITKDVADEGKDVADEDQDLELEEGLQ